MIKCSKFIKSKHVWILLMLCLSFFCHANTHAHQEKTGRGKFYVIGTGPAGPEHATYKAIECIREADVILCSDDMSERFSMYLKGKTLLGNPWRGKFKYKWKNIEELGTRENFGPSHRIIEGFEEDEVEIIPGLGCFQATMAALKKSSIPAYDTRFVMLTAPFFLLGRPENENILADLSKYPITMAFYMALKHADSLIAKLKKYYASDLPVAVVYNAGYPKKEKVVKGTLGTILDDIKSEKENWLGMIIVGRCLEGQPQRGMIKHVVR